MRNVRRIAGFLALVLVCREAYAAEAVKISKDEVLPTISGKTMSYTAPNGALLHVYFDANGHLMGKSSGLGDSVQSSGDWTVDGDGKICQKIRQGPMLDRCYFLMRADGTYRLSPNGTILGPSVTLE